MKIFTVCFLLIGVVGVNAAPIRFDFVFEDPNNGARAEGYIVFEETLMVNPTGSNTPDLPEGTVEEDGSYLIPGPEVLDLAFTVTGSQTSNGTYGLDDYEEVILFTNGGTLNFNAELIGQPTNDSPWGTVYDGSAGDFNLFSNDLIIPPQGNRYAEDIQGEGEGGFIPNGCNYFELCTAADNMILVSMRGTPSVVPSVPATSSMSILILSLSSLLVGFWFFRKS